MNPEWNWRPIAPGGSVGGGALGWLRRLAPAFGRDSRDERREINSRTRSGNPGRQWLCLAFGLGGPCGRGTSQGLSLHSRAPYGWWFFMGGGSTASRYWRPHIWWRPTSAVRADQGGPLQRTRQARFAFTAFWAIDLGQYSSWYGNMPAETHSCGCVSRPRGRSSP